MNSTGNLLDSLISFNDGAVVRQVAQRFGIPEDSARGAIQSMMPALSRGIERNIAQEGGLDDSILEQVLPMLAAAGMGMLAKRR